MKTQAPFMIRQGDVALMAVAEIPADAEPMRPDSDGVVLAHGEVTGHRHRIERAAEMFRAGGRVFLKIDAETALVHEEHSAIPLSPGAYQVIRQREWTDAEEPIQVAD